MHKDVDIKSGSNCYIVASSRCLSKNKGYHNYFDHAVIDASLNNMLNNSVVNITSDAWLISKVSMRIFQ